MGRNQSRRRDKAAKVAARSAMMQNAMMALAGSGYNGASFSRPGLSGWRPRAGDADADTIRDLPTLRARSRDLERNSPLAGGAINTTVTNVVGTGLTLQAIPDRDILGLTDEEAEAWADNTEREFRLWAESKDCDVTRHQNFYEMTSLAFRSTLASGDAGAVLPFVNRGPQQVYKLAVQLVEADRICNPSFVKDIPTLTAGVEMDEWGAATHYHVASHHPGALTNRALIKWQRVAAYGSSTGRRNFLHLFDRRRIGQVRGVPMLAPVIEPLKQLQRYTDAELQAAVISGMYAIFVKMDPEAFDTIFDDSGKSAYLGSAVGWDGSVNGASLEDGGKAINLLPGETIESANPGRPNALFDPFVQAIIRQIGVSLEIPFEVLVKHFTSSYSAARAALLDAWRFFRGRRDWAATAFCQPVYEAWLEEAVSIGRIRAPGFFADPAIRKAWVTAAWIGDGPGSIDPSKEVDAAVKRIDAGISTLASESILHDGIDWRVKHRQRLVEQKAREEGGLLPPEQAPASAQPPVEPDQDDATDKKPQTLIHLHNHLPPATAPNVNVAAPNVEVAVEAIMPEQVAANITVEAVMPRAEAPVVHIDVAPTPVTVEASIQSAPTQIVMQHPVAARQTVERDPQTQEIVATVTTYSTDTLA
jgi:lambda family phage portal protein